MGSAVPGGQKNLFGQGSGSTVPASLQVRPAGQLRQNSLAFAGWYVPGAHKRGTELPVGQKCPIGQG
eukprot:scaffold1110_cov254-Pinguiococcus_pyrenoidosus.AAC.9